MMCESKHCDKTFEKRSHVNCPVCGTPGVSILYKHRAIDNHFWKPLEEENIWCPSPHSLNDPFEFDFFLRTQHIGRHSIDQESLAEAKNDMKKHGVISLTEICTNIQMWAYYSDSHRGVCLGFERNATNDLGKWDHCVPVQYSPGDELPAVMPLELTKSRTLTKILTTKSNAWSHECEWRLITRRSDRAISYPGRLVRVIFGINTTAEHRERIMTTLGDTVEYFEISKGKQHFTLAIIPVATA